MRYYWYRVLFSFWLLCMTSAGVRFRPFLTNNISWYNLRSFHAEAVQDSRHIFKFPVDLGQYWLKILPKSDVPSNFDYNGIDHLCICTYHNVYFVHCEFIYIYIYMNIKIFTCEYKYIYIWIYNININIVYTYIYIYIFEKKINVNIYIYIYICTYTCE